MASGGSHPFFFFACPPFTVPILRSNNRPHSIRIPAMKADFPEKELRRQGYSVHIWSNGPDFWYPVHDHPYSKVIVVLKGSIIFYMLEEKREVPLKAGERLELAPHT